MQSPWTVKNDKGETEIMKQECYVFDFALDRALRQISDYSCRLNVDETDPEKKVSEFISFLVLVVSQTYLSPFSVSGSMSIEILSLSRVQLSMSFPNRYLAKSKGRSTLMQPCDTLRTDWSKNRLLDVS